MSTNLVNGANEASQANSPINNNLGQQDFLRLMIAQIQKQDLMRSQVNGEFLSQLEQFNTNNGVAQMLESLQQLTTSLQSNQALQASALVGRKVLVNCDTVQLGIEGDITAVVDILFGHNKLNASIYAETGELIKRIPIGDSKPGFFEFSWDGTGLENNRMKEGKYKIEVHAVYEEKNVSLSPLISANVDSVSIGHNGEGLKLNVSGIGSVTLDQVKQIFI